LHSPTTNIAKLASDQDSATASLSAKATVDFDDYAAQGGRFGVTNFHRRDNDQDKASGMADRIDNEFRRPQEHAWKNVKFIRTTHAIHANHRPLMSFLVFSRKSASKKSIPVKLKNFSTSK
jgi:hypothetical protein